MKKKVILILALVICCASVVGGVFLAKRDSGKEGANTTKKTAEETSEKETKSIRENKEQWENTAVVSPAAGSLKACGVTKITWNPADEMGKVSGYKVYVDDELVESTDGETTTCTYYTTDVTKHTVYVEADMGNGSVLYSDVNTFFTNKKGFCTNKDMAMNLNATDWGVSWYYNWAMFPFKLTSFQDLDYVPMLWTIGPSDDRNMQLFNSYDFTYVLAYNEPDLAEQANLTVDEVMKGLETVFANKGDVLLGAPATALLPPWSKDWFQPFMEKVEAKNWEFDFIPLHHYWNWYDDEGVDAFLELVDKSYEMYHKPIWITEFAISGVPDVDERARKVVRHYMKKVVAELDKREYVERYAWFSFQTTDRRNGASAMFNHYTGDITSLGKLYMKVGMPEGYGDAKYSTPTDNEKEDVVKE